MKEIMKRIGLVILALVLSPLIIGAGALNASFNAYGTLGNIIKHGRIGDE